MAVVEVIAEMNNSEYELSENGGVYEESVAAPDASTSISVTAIDEHGNTSTISSELNVYSEWLPPKTDWTATDYFNIEDYNRITGNLEYLKTLGTSLFYGFPSIASLGDDKTYTSMIYAREINAIEDCLEKLNLGSYSFDIGDKKIYYANQSTITYSELNRIESAILLLYKTMTAHKEALPKLSFRLGGQKGIRV